jgi:uncharacterized protein YndB with AHSA1/START domain
MTEHNFNKSEFHHSILLNIPVEKVYYYAATPEGICKWFLGEAIYKDSNGTRREPAVPAETGDTFIWKWLAKDLCIEGTILNTVKNEKFVFTFGKSFIITITLSVNDGRTMFTLQQEYTSGAVKNDFAFINCCVCWTFFLTNLKSAAEHGIDLRETLSHDESLVNR